MSGILTNKSEYFKGQYTSFGLKQAVAKAGGDVHHLELFNLLINPSFSAIDKETNKKTILFDCRAPQSMLFLLPPKLQIPIIILLYKEELAIKEGFVDDPYGYYTVSTNILHPTKVLQISQGVTKTPFGKNFINLLNSLSDKSSINRNTEQKLKFLLCIKNQDRLFDYKDRDIRIKIDRIANIINVDSPYLSVFKEITAMNNRIQAAAVVAQSLGYTQACIQSIVTTIERWLLSNT